MRKSTIITITDEGRDHGKRFLVKELSAYQAEKWAQRAVLALSHAGVDLGGAWASGGMAALAVAGLRSLEGLRFEEAEPLLDEMLECVFAIPDPKHPEAARPLVIDSPEAPDHPRGSADDVQEVVTYWRLREAVFELHTGFFEKWILSKSRKMTKSSRARSTAKTSPARSRA